MSPARQPASRSSAASRAFDRARPRRGAVPFGKRGVARRLGLFARGDRLVALVLDPSSLPGLGVAVDHGAVTRGRGIVALGLDVRQSLFEVHTLARELLVFVDALAQLGFELGNAGPLGLDRSAHSPRRLELPLQPGHTRALGRQGAGQLGDLGPQ